MAGKAQPGDSLVGVTWGWWEVIAPAARPAGNTVQVRGTWWLCRCRCGREVVMPRQYIRTKQSNNCGCRRRKAEKPLMDAEICRQKKPEPIRLSRQDEINLRGNITMARCYRCKKVFEKISPDWKYAERDNHGRERYYCSWHCFRGDEAVKPKLTLTERARMQSERAL